MTPSDPHPAASPSTPVIREARPEDREQVLAIRAEEILTGTALWTDTVPAPEQADAWFAAHLAARSMLVAAGPDDLIAGFASFSPLRPYDGYRFTGEDSIYLTAAARGRGLGRALLAALVERARAAGLHSLVGNIEAGNAASIVLHERCGFARVGRMPQAGWKFGRWLDLEIMQRML